MGVEFSVDYELVMDAARRFDQAAGEFQEITGVLLNLGTQLQTTWLVGLAGAACMRNTAFLQGRFAQLIAKANEMQSDLLATVQQFRDDVDPGMAARFDG